MKKLLLMIALFCAVSVQAQTEKGAMAAGANVSLGFGDSYTNFGLGVKYQYNVANRIRLEPGANYYFKKDYMSMWDFCVNVHYLFTITDGLNFYPLVGMGVAGAKLDLKGAASDILGDDYKDYAGAIMDGMDDSITKFAFNLGLGAEYMVASNVSMNLEYKYRISSDLNRSLLSLGVAYHF